jgi:mono/diheme cytochrome c family protein
MIIRMALVWFSIALTGSASAQDSDDVQQGRRVADLVCNPCHVIARDDPHRPLLEPAAPSFDSIAQRPDLTAASLQAFLKTTHSGVGNLRGMPNPGLVDSYARQVVTYILSLRRTPR